MRLEWGHEMSEEPRPRCNAKDCKTHLFGCLVPSHCVLHLPSMDGQTMFPTTEVRHYLCEQMKLQQCGGFWH